MKHPQASCDAEAERLDAASLNDALAQGVARALAARRLSANEADAVGGGIAVQRPEPVIDRTPNPPEPWLGLVYKWPDKCGPNSAA